MKLASCHPERKMQARNMCKSCYDKWLKAVNPSYKKSQLSNTTKWAKANPEKMLAIQKRRQEKDKNDPASFFKKRNRSLKLNYGITNNDYEKLLVNQNGGCALCFRKPKPGKHLHVDHCHKTKKVRGLLCHQCNWYMGTIDADHSILDRILNYLGDK